jgi:hypothetical protein
MILEFREPIEVDTPLGRGHALYVHITAHDNHWTVALNESKAFVTFTQDRLRATNSYTHGRGIDDARMREIIKPRSR